MLCSYRYILVHIRMRLSVGSEYNGFVYIFLRGLTRLDDRLLLPSSAPSCTNPPTKQRRDELTPPPGHSVGAGQFISHPSSHLAFSFMYLLLSTITNFVSLSFFHLFRTILCVSAHSCASSARQIYYKRQASCRPSHPPSECPTIVNQGPTFQSTTVNGFIQRTVFLVCL